MITFVIWCNNPEMLKDFRKSVRFEAEYIALGQTFGSLASAYTFGQEMAHGDIIVYCHQDIIIHDPDFETKLTVFFDLYKNVGWAGVIGNSEPAGREWWLPEKNRRGWIRQTDHTGKTKPVTFDFGRGTQKAAQLDGCFLATNRTDWDFPPLPGIHFLDLWMCNLAAERGFQNYIVDVDIEHRSWGETASHGYEKNYGQYLQRWGKYLKLSS